MYISKLVLQGFKSFLKRTEVEFGQGITAVVGPNGCGKTNIIDAIRWVIGEQKPSVLRSERITDVIFNGTATRRPLNVAEVSLVIHNVSGRMPIAYTDVEITRRLYRNGESEYFINRNLCRLKDITDLFLDTGMGANAYSIIELKMIEDLLSETPEERKRLFEEAAGVNKYRLQRKAAIRKLEATHDDLVRLNDIIGEIENNVRNLKRQLQRYEKYQEISQKLIEAEVQLASRRVQNLREKYQPVQASILAKHGRLAELNTLIGGLEVQANQHQQTLLVKEEQLNHQRQEMEDASERWNQAKTELLLLNEDLRHQQQDLIRLSNSLTELTQNKVNAQKRHAEITQEIQTVIQQLEAKRQQFKQIATEGEAIIQRNQQTADQLQKLQDERFHLLRAQAEFKARQQNLQDNIQTRQAELENILNQIEKLSSQQTDLTQKISLAQTKLEQLQTERNTNQQILAELTQRINTLTEQRGKLLDEIRLADGTLDRLNNQIQFYQGIIQSKEGFEPGLQYVLDHLSEFPGIRGALSDLIHTEQHYYPAVEAVLKDISRLLVADTKAAALQAINRLSELKKGRVAIVPLDADLPKKASTSAIGLKPLSEYLHCQPALESLKQFLFGQIWLCEDEQFDRYINDPNYAFLTLVTEKGRLREASGILSGGSTAAESQQLLGRQARLKEYEKEYVVAKRERDELQQQLDLLETELKDTRQKQQQSQKDQLSLTQQFDQSETQLKNAQNLLAQLNTRLQSLSDQKVATQMALETFKAKLQKEIPQENETTAKVQQLDTAMAQLNITAKSNKADLDAWNSRTQNVRIELLNLENRNRNLTDSLNALEGSLKRTTQQIIAIETERENLRQRIADSQQKAQEHTKQVELLQQKVQQIKLAFTTLQKDYQQLRLLQDDINRQLSEARREKETISAELKQFELDLANYLARENEICAVLQQKFNRTLPTELPAELPSEEEALQAVERQKHQLELIGTVNLAVKEEYEQEKARLDFLTEQRDDLVESEKGLNTVIQQIDKIAREQFMAIFDQIQANFKQTFEIFFGGGEAELKLVGHEDPLEADIEIWACPGGKKMRTLRMLSAGEKALTAIALLFAIYQVKPSPFCILDEVDAPLDDENIRRFINVIKTFAERTQFIIVTHNKATMTIADTLYGVTMGEKGVSQLVSVRLE
jgi:chromosome segregation protein